MKTILDSKIVKDLDGKLTVKEQYNRFITDDFADSTNLLRERHIDSLDLAAMLEDDQLKREQLLE